MSAKNAALEVFVVLATNANINTRGTVDAVDLGWDRTSTDTASPSVVVVFIRVQWDEPPRQVEWLLRLLDADGAVLMFDSAQVGLTGTRPLDFAGHFAIQRHESITPGAPQMVKLLQPVPPLGLSPGRYEWRLTLDGEGGETWRAPFRVRQAE